MDIYRPDLGLTLVIAAHHKAPRWKQKEGEIGVKGYRRKRIKRESTKTPFKVKKNTMVNTDEIYLGSCKTRAVKVSHASIGYRGLVLLLCTLKKPKSFRKGENIILKKGTLKVTL